MPKDDSPKPKPPKNDGGDEPETTPHYYIAPDGRPHIDENDDDSTNQSVT